MGKGEFDCEVMFLESALRESGILAGATCVENWYVVLRNKLRSAVLLRVSSVYWRLFVCERGAAVLIVRIGC